MVALWGGLGAPTHSPGTTDRRCSLPSPFHSPKIRAERAPAIPAADDVSAWLPASLACFRRYLDDFDFQLVPPLSSALSPILLLLPPRTVSAPPSPAARKRRRTMDDFARFVKRHAVRREKSRRERERERISSGKKKKKKKKIGRRSGEEERGESDGWRNAAWIRGENRVSIRMDDATRPVRIIGSIDRISRRRSVADIHVHGSTTSGPGGSP